MNLGEAVDNIAKKLGNRTDLDASIKSEIQLAQAELEAGRTLPWFLLQKELTVTLEADATEINVPEDFLREYEGGSLWLYDSAEADYVQLVKVPLDTLRDVEAGEDDDSPVYYSLVGTNFYFAPPPAEAKTLRIVCYRRAEALSDDGDENVWLDNEPELLLARAGMRMAQYLRSTELYAMFQSQYVERMQAMEHAGVARDMENFEASMGGA